MKPSSQKERAALAAVYKADQEEENRATWWRVIARSHKKRALLVANIDTRRVDDPLGAFTIQERQAISSALTSHIAQMELIILSMGVGMAQLTKKSIH